MAGRPLLIRLKVLQKGNIIKRILWIMLAGALLLSAAGCTFCPELFQASASHTEAPTQPPATVATTAPATVPATAPTLATKPATLPPETAAPTVPEPEDGDFVRLADYIPTARIALAYATDKNFTGRIIYNFTDAYLRYGTVKKLMEVSRELEEYGLGLVIWDAFRPVAAQAALWEICPDPAYVSHPVTGKRTHCRGNTVDISLYDLSTGENIPMPTGFDDFSPYADRDYSDCSQEVAANAMLLEQIMEKYGFTPYFYEWWHYADTTDYPVEEVFYPPVP